MVFISPLSQIWNYLRTQSRSWRRFITPILITSWVSVIQMTTSSHVSGILESIPIPSSSIYEFGFLPQGVWKSWYLPSSFLPQFHSCRHTPDARVHSFSLHTFLHILSGRVSGDTQYDWLYVSLLHSDWLLAISEKMSLSTDHSLRMSQSISLNILDSTLMEDCFRACFNQIAEALYYRMDPSRRSSSSPSQ